MRIGICFLACLLVCTCRPVPEKGATRSLFNGTDLSGWDTYIGPDFDSAGNLVAGTEIGLNKDPMQVFTVVEEDGAPAIRISGQRFGGLSTHDEFENYHLRLQFKWGGQRWHPRANQKRDSGILYHAVGDHAGDGGFWMRSHECQVQEGDCGDYWGVAGASADIPARADSGAFRYELSSPRIAFSEDGPNGRHCIKYPDAEKPSGEWNVAEIICHGDSSVHIINGEVVMKLFGLRQHDNGTRLPLRKGKIQIQSEGAEVFYRRIEIIHIDRMPDL